MKEEKYATVNIVKDKCDLDMAIKGQHINWYTNHQPLGMEQTKPSSNKIK